MIHPIIRIRRLLIPPCTECAHFERKNEMLDPYYCTRPQAVRFNSKLEAGDYKELRCAFQRGRFGCKFERVER